MRWALAALFVSAALQSACFARWPGNPTADVHYSIFAAENLVVHGQLKSLNSLADYGHDLAQQARLRWMMHWPPAHSLLFAAVMSLGLPAGAATKLLGFLCIVAGGAGWVYLARVLGAPGYCIVVIAAVYPWLPYTGGAYLYGYANECPALALLPWICFAMLQIKPLSESSGERWIRLLIAAILAGTSVLVKYSLAPVLFAAVLYLLWLDGTVVDRRRISRVAAFSGVLVAFAFLPWLISRAYGETYPLSREAGVAVLLPSYGSNLLENTILDPPGWDRILKHLGPGLGKIFHLPLQWVPIFLFASLALLVIWLRHFRRFPWRDGEKSFGVLLLLLTAGLWMMLGLAPSLIGIRWDFTSDGRLYIPIALLWLLSCGVSLGKMDRKELFGSIAFYSLAVPITFTAVFYAGTGVMGRPYVRMPNSGVAWMRTDDRSHASFLSNLAAVRGRKPDLLVAEPQDMTELRVPCLNAEIAVGDNRRYWSSMNLEAWAMIEPEKEESLLANFSRASSVERIRVPDGFPFVFYIFRFTAEGNESGKGR